MYMINYSLCTKHQYIYILYIQVYIVCEQSSSFPLDREIKYNKTKEYKATLKQISTIQHILI